MTDSPDPLSTQQFDQHINILTSRLEGNLYKWTNPLKGWQPRWFNVDQQQGVLHYYTVRNSRGHKVTGLWLVKCKAGGMIVLGGI